MCIRDSLIIVLVIFVPVWIRVFVQITSDDSLRLVPLRHAYGFNGRFGTDPGVKADEVYKVGAV